MILGPPWDSIWEARVTKNGFQKNDEKKENIYSNIDDMLNRSLKSEEE